MEKIRAGLMVCNGTIISMDAECKVITNGALVVKGQKILDIGTVKDITAKYTAEEILDASGMIVMPGMVDTHFHTAQQFERGLLGTLAKDGNFKVPFWLNYLVSFEASLTDEDILLSAQFAYANMLKVGTTCFADAGGPKPEIMAEALKETGIRGVLVRSTLDLQKGVPFEMRDTPQGILEKGRRLHKTWHGAADGRVRIWMGMRQILICSQGLLRDLRDLALELDTGIHIHLGEGTYEVDFAIEVSGMRPAMYLESLGFLDAKVHAGHSVLLSNQELDLYEQYDVSASHCPAPAFMAMGAPKIPEMLKRGIRVGLGTDGAISSGGSLDLFKQQAISYYALVAAYGRPYHDKAPISNLDLLQMATIGGARALRWEDEIGSLEVGKKADMILLSCDDLDVLPVYDPVFMAASNAGPTHVHTVLVDGKVVVRDGKLTMVDEEELKARVKERAPKIVERFLARLGD
ncbi:MAG: amidohydrolase family protein [Anaerolineaceae bacterium]|nr:amidohydrolase family protein [Anaerolineaceae bacterium]